MRRIALAFRVFFRILFDAAWAERIRPLLTGPAPAESKAAAATPPKRPTPATPVRSDALNLLAALQREARFLDFITEPLEGFSDAQVGAAARQVHRDCGQVVQRLFAPRPVMADEEGAEVEIAAGFDAGRCRLTGNVTGQPPFRGRLVHHGWEATLCQLPVWSGSPAAAQVIAAAEVELK